MTTDKDDSTLQVPEPLLQKVRRLNSSMKGVDNPAMTTREPPTPSIHKDSTSSSADSSKGPATGTSWVFTPTKKNPDDPRLGGTKNFQESWVTIERYIENRRKEALVRKQTCSCYTRKCRFVSAVSFLAALVMAAIILIVYFVVFSKKGYMTVAPIIREPTLFPPIHDVAPSSAQWENQVEETTTFPDFSTSTSSAQSVTTDFTTSSAFTTPPSTTLPTFLSKHLSFLLTSTEKVQSTTRMSMTTPTSFVTPTWIGGFVPMTQTPNPDLKNLLLLPGPLQRLGTDDSS